MSLNGIQEVKAHRSQGWGKAAALFTEVPLCPCARVCVCVCTWMLILCVSFNMMSGSERSIFGWLCVC